MYNDLSIRSAILTYGDSQGEVLDYLFHADPRFVTFEADPRVGWNCGWSTRGLKKDIHKARIFESVADRLKDPAMEKVFVFLSFGCTDIEWNLAYKRDVQNKNPDTDIFIDEMTAALMGVIHGLQSLPSAGEELQIVLQFPFAPLPLAEDYGIRHYPELQWSRVCGYEERRSLWKQFTASMSEAVAKLESRVPIVDVTAEFEAKGDAAFMRKAEECHHPDYIKSQVPVAERIRELGIDGLEPYPSLESLYPYCQRPLPTTAVPAPKIEG